MSDTFGRLTFHVHTCTVRVVCVNIPVVSGNLRTGRHSSLYAGNRGVSLTRRSVSLARSGGPSAIDQLNKLLLVVNRYLLTVGRDQLVFFHPGYFTFERRTGHTEVFGQRTLGPVERHGVRTLFL